MNIYQVLAIYLAFGLILMATALNRGKNRHSETYKATSRAEHVFIGMFYVVFWLPLVVALAIKRRSAIMNYLDAYYSPK